MYGSGPEVPQLFKSGPEGEGFTRLRRHASYHRTVSESLRGKDAKIRASPLLKILYTRLKRSPWPSIHFTVFISGDSLKQSFFVTDPITSSRRQISYTEKPDWEQSCFSHYNKELVKFTQGGIALTELLVLSNVNIKQCTEGESVLKITYSLDFLKTLKLINMNGCNLF